MQLVLYYLFFCAADTLRRVNPSWIAESGWKFFGSEKVLVLVYFQFLKLAIQAWTCSYIRLHFAYQSNRGGYKR